MKIFALQWITGKNMNMRKRAYCTLFDLEKAYIKGLNYIGCYNSTFEIWLLHVRRKQSM